MCTCCRLYADYDRLQVLLKITRLAKVWRVEHRGPQKIWIRQLIQTLLCNVNVTNFIVKFAINCNWINSLVMLYQMKLIWYFLRIVCVYDEDGRFCSLQARYYGLKFQNVLRCLVLSIPGWLRKIPDTPTECCTTHGLIVFKSYSASKDWYPDSNNETLILLWI